VQDAEPHGSKNFGHRLKLLTITGVTKLGGTEHRMLPDMIEIGSFIGLAAMTESEITIKNVSYDELGVIPEVFKKLGIKLERRGDDIYVPSQKNYVIDTFIDGSILTIADAPWPGFTPDLIEYCTGSSYTGKGFCSYPPKDVRKPPIFR
jgi:UDP-N-acetylglucosamine 1-carboxyvinyltransferase